MKAISAHGWAHIEAAVGVASSIAVAIVASPGQLANARRVAAWLATSLAHHTRQPARVAEAGDAGPTAGHVVVVLPSSAPRLRTPVTRAIAILDSADAAGERAAIAAASSLADATRVRLVQLTPSAHATRRIELALSRAYDGRAVTCVPSAESAQPPAAIDRLARDAAGMLVGIALGAGGTRGFTHVGVLETLVAHGVPIDCIAGTSIGAVVGTLWAFGHPPDEIVAMVADTRRHVLRLTVPLRSLLSNRGIRAHIEASAAGRAFEDSPIPLAAVSTDLHDGSRVVIQHGDLAPAILASSSIPGVFPAVSVGGRTLVDGGVCEPVPTTSVTELGAQIVIGVSLGTRHPPPLADRKPFGLVGTLLRANEILQARVDEQTATRAHVVIAPLLDGSAFELPELGSAARFRAAGRAAALAALPRLRQLLPWLPR